MSDSNVINMDDYRLLEDIIKQRLGATHVVVSAVLEDGTFSSFVPGELPDIDFVYIIQTLKDRRNERLR